MRSSRPTSLRFTTAGGRLSYGVGCNREAHVTTVLFLVAAVALIANIVASTLLLCADDLDKSQQIAQLLLVWLVPIAGAAIVIAIRREFLRPHKQTPPVPESSDDNAVDLAIWARRGSRRNESETESE